VVSAQVILQRARIGRSRHNVEDVVSCVPREAVAFQATEWSRTAATVREYAQHVDVVNASASLFSLLAIPPQLGRAILADDGRYGRIAPARGQRHLVSRCPSR